MLKLLKSEYKYLLVILIIYFFCNIQICLANENQSNELELQVPILTYTASNSIAYYIAEIYRAGLYLIVPVAIIIIIYSGFLWIIAGGDQSKIQSAKSRILYSILGLFIALFSYVVLSTIGITELRMPGIENIPPEAHEDLEFHTWEMGQSLGAGSDYASVGGQCFPVPQDSLRNISWNFKAGRKGKSGARYHAGVDIYTKSPGTVIAIADGTVTAISRQFYACGARACQSWAKGGMTGKVMINHGNFTVNYAEIDANKIADGIKVGTKVVAGQFLGYATHCCMLHFELYEGNTSQSRAWMVGKPKPANLMDPTNTLKELQSKQCQRK